jgi:hypothetical protein
MRFEAVKLIWLLMSGLIEPWLPTIGFVDFASFVGAEAGAWLPTSGEEMSTVGPLDFLSLTAVEDEACVRLIGIAV